MKHQMAQLPVVTMVLAACSITTAPLTSGVYPLVAYGGKSIPADIGILPPKGVPGDTAPRDPGGCHILVTAGSLTLDVEGRAYALQYETRNACDQQLLSNPSSSGAFDQAGRELVFHFMRVDGDRTFTGRVEGSRITVMVDGGLVFSRR